MVRNHAVYEWIRQYDRTAKGSLPVVVEEDGSTKQTTLWDIWQNATWNEYSLSCRVSDMPLHINSGTCRTTAPWIVRCGRSCIQHIEYIHDSKSKVHLPMLREKGLSYISGYENEDMSLDLHSLHTIKELVNSHSNHVSYIHFNDTKVRKKSKSPKMDFRGSSQSLEPVKIGRDSRSHTRCNINSLPKLFSRWIKM